MNKVEPAKKVTVQAALSYALTNFEKSTTTEANAATLQHRMLDTKLIDNESFKAQATKDLKQMVEGGSSKEVKDWPQRVFCEARLPGQSPCSSMAG